VSRFSQAISEGDGISVIPALVGDVASLATEAEEAGAEAIAVATRAEAEVARAAAALPVLVREPIRDGGQVVQIGEAGADAVVCIFEDLDDEDGVLEELQERAADLDVDLALDVGDDDELVRALERIDPDIVLISRRGGGSDEEELERALDLLPDVPAGKLVVAESGAVTREQVLALERAGVDALIVRDLGAGPGFGVAIRALVGAQASGPSP
jgi:indole-3-glycerol phosphate synthase